ncbi:sulfatase [Haloarcula marismortui]|uniref:Sulfatase n=1 Tax=Haloarcula marismortui ATCC 33799 TaxID=662475 RepID=M0JVW3_9EURY|nr:sulfatase [Haloarcula californiae]EMA11800.1 sulfatase [Haloarcula californiae ATCC 33799]
MQQPNILLVIMDTARADYVEDERVMPNLHEFAEEGTWFPNTFANAPWTLPSHSSLFTGRYPSEHGTTGAEKYFDSETTLMSALSDNGYQTISFSNNPWISPEFGFDDFDEFVPCWQLFRRGAGLASISQKEGLNSQIRALASKLADSEAPFTIANALYMKFIEGRYDSGAALTNYRVKRWLTKRTEQQPFFAFVNYMEPHLEYNPPKKYREEYLSEDERQRWSDVNQDPWACLVGTAEMTDSDFKLLRNLYRSELHYLDARLERLFNLLKTTGELDSTVVIITGDHGEHLGERGLMDHQYSLSEELLRVPLLVRYPSVFDRGKCDDRLVELRDLFATILSLAEVDNLGYAEKETPSLDLTENGGRDAVISEYLTPQPSIDTLCERYDVDRQTLEKYDRTLRSIRTPKKKLVEESDGSCQYFEIKDGGPQETDFLDDSDDELIQMIECAVGEFPQDTDDEGDRTLPESNRQRLEDLGYL